MVCEVDADSAKVAIGIPADRDVVAEVERLVGQVLVTSSPHIRYYRIVAILFCGD